VTERKHIPVSDTCWCAPVVVHVPPLAKITHQLIVSNVRDADRLAALGFPNVVVSPDVPTQRGS
jgi:hypothetical protein